ncbi:MAG: aminotransferase class I/II-fold pyridoxal phosphate-dependent enzyme [Verrucomicrobiota bacterium]|nr:aminotransferase class I/II-fold pyridoxal phosphate-dependent enzyme [Verrucomicrobiota bacterium]
MRTSFLSFSSPSISEEEIASVADVLRSGWITTGPNCGRFEDAFTEYTGTGGSVAVSSATGGMHCVLQALEIGVGDEVITPSLTWVSTVNLICLQGATPVFSDIDRDTLMISRETIEPLITEKTKLIIPVHYAGASADMDPIRELCAERGIHLVEDAAHAAGTEYKGERIGKKGTSIFSFHPIKNMTTGEGGMVCSDDAELLAKVKSLKFHGLGVDAFDRQTQGRAPQAQVLKPGYKYNLTDIAAVLGLGQLQRLDGFNARRTELANLYHEQLADIPEIMPLGIPGHEHLHAWHLFIVRLDIDHCALDRAGFMAALKERNIGTGLHFRAVHLQKYYVDTMGCKPGMLPGTEWNSDRIFSLPFCPSMSDGDVADVVDAIKDVLKTEG